MQVEVLSGRDKGKQGVVSLVARRKNSVMVEGVNTVKLHTHTHTHTHTEYIIIVNIFFAASSFSSFKGGVFWRLHHGRVPHSCD